MNPTTSHESRTTKPADKKNDGGGDAGDVRTGGPAARVDPDDSDDSDLDDILDNFGPASSTDKGVKPPLPAPASATVSDEKPRERPRRDPLADSDDRAEFDEEEFLKQLQAGMAQMMNASVSTAAATTAAAGPKSNQTIGEGMKTTPSDTTTSKGPPPPSLGNEGETSRNENGIENEIPDFEALSREMGDDPKAAEFMRLLKSEHTTSTSSGQPQPQSQSQSQSHKPTLGNGDENFHDKIRRTMERMQQSGDQATAAAAEDTADDPIAQLLKIMGAGDGEGDDGANEEGFDKMLMGMMEQMTNKDILYEPMTELNRKFGPWLTENRDRCPAEQFQKYEEQAAIVKEIVDKFDERGYSDDKSECRAFIWEKMQVMQGIGAPPDDLVDNPMSDDKWMKDAMNTGDGQPGCPSQ